MEMWVAVLIATAVVLALAVGLMLAFNGSDRADARGRRIDHRWRTRRGRA